MLKAMIFDRDGTLNRTTQILRAGQRPGDPTDGYVLGIDEAVLLPGTVDALSLLIKNEIQCFVFTQQNCIYKGLISQRQIEVIHKHINSLLGNAITAFHVACGPDDPKAKPSPQMILDILAENSLQPDEVLVVGDSLRDYQAAKAAAVDFAWVRDDLGRVSEGDMAATGCPVFDDVAALVRNYFHV